MNMNALLGLCMARNRFQNLLLSLRAEALDVSHLAGFTRGAQLFDALDSQFFLQAFDFPNRQAGNARELDDARRQQGFGEKGKPGTPGGAPMLFAITPAGRPAFAPNSNSDVALSAGAFVSSLAGLAFRRCR